MHVPEHGIRRIKLSPVLEDCGFQRENPAIVGPDIERIVEHAQSARVIMHCDTVEREVDSVRVHQWVQRNEPG